MPPWTKSNQLQQHRGNHRADNEEDINMEVTFGTSSGDLQMKVGTSLLEAAIGYARRGFTIFPVVPGGKKPVLSWGAEATKDEVTIRRWWEQNPGYNIGIVTGAKSGVVVIDFDTEDAWATGQKMGLPTTPLVKTGKGYHVYCKHQDGVRNFQKRGDLPGIDLRGEGGYVVAPPSVHETGERYSWVQGHGLDDIELGEMPSWISPKAADEKVSLQVLADGVSEGSRNDSLARLVGSWLHEGCSRDEVLQKAELWNQKNTPPLDGAEVQRIIDSIYGRELKKLPASAEWGEPHLFSDIDAETVKADMLPGWLGDYALAVSRFTQTPEALAVMVGLSVVATCAQKRFEVSPYGDEYHEPLSLWTVTVLSPSERKTPVFSAMTKPLSDWEASQATLLETQIRETATNICILEKRIDKLRNDAAKAEEADERARITQQIHDLQNEMPDPVYNPKLWTGDVTPERLQDLLVENEERMSLLSDEGGIFEIMAGLYSDNKVNIDVFLQAYSGSSVRVDRKSRSVSMDRPAITFGLTVQPAVINDFSQGSKKKFRGKGALARFLYCFPESMLGRRVIGQRTAITAEVKARYHAGINKLLPVQKNTDGDGKEIPRLLVLTKDALAVWEEFSVMVEAELGEDGEMTTFSDWGGKLPGTALRVAGLMHLVERGPEINEIEKGTMEKSIELCGVLIGHARVAFGMIGTDEAVVVAKKVYKWIEKKGFEGFARNICQRDLHGSIPKAELLDKALSILEIRNIIKEHVIQTSGRPSKCYEVNPVLKTMKE